MSMSTSTSTQSPPPSPQEIDGNTNSSTVMEDPELGTEGDSEFEQDQSLIRRQGSDASSSSSSSSDSNGSEYTVVGRVRTLIGSTANLCSATLGAGILALPYAFHQAGIVCGVLLLLLSAWATVSSIGLLAEIFDTHKLSTYEKAVEKGLGRRFRRVVEVSILVFCCGTAVGYVKAVGDIMERVVPYPMSKAHEQVAMCAVWLGAMLPLSCLRKMKSLEFASSVGIMSIGTLLVAATAHLVRSLTSSSNNNSIKHHDYDDQLQVLLLDNMYSFDDDEGYVFESYDSRVSSILSLLGPAGGSWLSVMQACPIFFYAFSSQVNVAQIFEELPGDQQQQGGGNTTTTNLNQKIETMKQVTLLGVSVCGILYASLSLVTLVDFGDRIQPNVLSCYNLGGSSNKGHQPLLHVAFLGMALAVVIAFPLNIFPARVSLIQMWEEEEKEEPLNEEGFRDDGDDDEAPASSMVEGIRQPLLSKESRRRRSAGYNSGGEAEEENEDSNDPLLVGSPTTAISVSRNDSIVLEEDGPPDEFHCRQHTVLTLFLAGLALGLALIVPNISVVFGLLGGTTSSLLGFVVPGLLGLKLDPNRIGAWVLVVFGSLIGVLTTGATIHSMIRGG